MLIHRVAADGDDEDGAEGDGRHGLDEGGHTLQAGAQGGEDAEDETTEADRRVSR
jgi:hypothetical protein